MQEQSESRPSSTLEPNRNDQQADSGSHASSLEQGTVRNNKIPTISRRHAMWQVYRRAFPMYMSYTFSFEVFELIVLSNYMKNGQGQNNINAAALSSAVMQLSVALGISLLLPASYFTSIKRGQLNIVNNPEEIQKINTAISATMKHMVALTLFNSTVVSIPLIFSRIIFTNLFGQHPDIAELASNFLLYYAAVVPLIVFRSGCEQILFGLNHQTPAMLMALFTFLIGSGFAFLFGYGIDPFPHWGYPGIAAGFGIDALMLCLMNGLYLGLHKDFNNFHFYRDLFRWNAEDWQQIKLLLNVGYPISIAFLVEYGADATMAFWAGVLGYYQQATLNFTSAARFFLIPGIVALGQAVCNEVSAAIGGKMYGNASRFARYGLLGSVLAITGLSIPPAVYPKLLTFALTNISLNEQVSSYLRILMPLTSASISVYTAGYVMLNTLRPAGDAHWPTVKNIFAIGMTLLAQYLLGFHTNLGIYGLYMGSLMGILLAAALLADRWIPRTNPSAFERTALMAAQPSGSVAIKTTYLSELSNCLPGVLRQGVLGSCNNRGGERERLLPTAVEARSSAENEITPRRVF